MIKNLQSYFNFSFPISSYTLNCMIAKIKAFLLRYELLILLLCFIAILRLPSLMEPYWYGDEGIYLTLGNGIRHGLQLYRDIHDNKPPGIYIIAAIASSQFWFRFILLVWNLANIAVFWWLAHRLLDREKNNRTFRLFRVTFPIPQYSTFAAFLFALFPFLAEGNIANGEIFMIFPVTIGMATLVWNWQRKGGHRAFAAFTAGIFFSLGFLIKVPAIFDAIAAGLFFFIYTHAYTPTKKWWMRPIQTVINGVRSLQPWMFGIAFLIPIFLSIGYYWKVGALQPYLSSALLQNVGYLSSWKTGSHTAANVGQTGLKNRAIIVGIVTLLFLLGASLFTQEAVFILVWFAYALFGALLSERPYPHYLIQIIPPLSLLLGYVVRELHSVMQTVVRHRRVTNTWQEYLSLIASVGAVAALVISVIVFKFWHYPIPPYYQNYVKFMTHRISRKEYFEFFDKSLPEQYVISEAIIKNTSEDDRIFLWGDLPVMYALTRRLPPGRFTSAYHIQDFGGFEETYNDIITTQPKFIVVDRYAGQFPNLSTIIEDAYQLRYSSARFLLFKRALPITIK
jgi:hypothetical protein